MKHSFARRATKLPLISLLLFILLSGCNRGKENQLPKSTGMPYEVVLEGDTDSIVTKMLTEDVTGLPQPEPLCRLIQVKKGKTQGNYLLVRTRIVVNIEERDSESRGKGDQNSDKQDFSVTLHHDENAAPQNIIRITAQSAQQLRERLNGERLRQIVDEVELKHLADIISSNPSKQNKEMQDEIKKMFGIDMKIPAAMNASKKAKDFIWISNNASSGMQNLLVMKVKSEERRAEKVKSEERRMKNSNAFHADDKALIDSILRTNMPGETDNMYMVIPHLSERGLWEMKGDAMGGPYVMHCIHRQQSQAADSKAKQLSSRQQGYNLYIIAFVYAPEMKKKILIKQLEAAISTIK